MKFITEGARDDHVILDAIAELEAARPVSDWDFQRQQLCVEALERFLDSVDSTVDLGDELVASEGEENQPKLRVNGVDISVRPEIILSGEDGGGSSVVGAVKLAFGKTSPLSGDAARYIAATVHQFVDQYLVIAGKSAPLRYCYVIDVFAGKSFTAPRAFVRRREDIAAACEEIRLLWPSI